jgi:hypothetical protein
MARRQLCARTGREQVQQIAAYSITLSALARGVAGTVSESAFAAFRLIENSNLVG